MATRVSGKVHLILFQKERPWFLPQDSTCPASPWAVRCFLSTRPSVRCAQLAHSASSQTLERKLEKQTSYITLTELFTVVSLKASFI